jgi:hypothetical protein
MLILFVSRISVAQLIFTGTDGTLKMVTKVAIPPSPSTHSTGGKTALTSLLTSTTNSASGKTFLGTRRIFMTKG